MGEFLKDGGYRDNNGDYYSIPPSWAKKGILSKDTVEDSLWDEVFLPFLLFLSLGVGVVMMAFSFVPSAFCGQFLAGTMIVVFAGYVLHRKV